MEDLMKRSIVGAFAVAVLGLPGAARAQECYIGEIRMFAGNFAPRGYALAQGQLLSIAQNTALFSILGTTYGGNGQTTFALPDLRGRAPIGTGQGPGLSSRDLGEVGGTETVTQTVTEMAAHTHPATARAASAPATHIRPQGRVLAKVDPTTVANVYAAGPADVDMAPDALAVGAAGGSQPQPNMSPFLGINFIVCMEGIFPPRN
jgi:microcystin-dependent protein